jgi:uncharacterized protein (UPF0333 family)
MMEIMKELASILGWGLIILLGVLAFTAVVIWFTSRASEDDIVDVIDVAKDNTAYALGQYGCRNANKNYKWISGRLCENNDGFYVDLLNLDGDKDVTPRAN